MQLHVGQTEQIRFMFKQLMEMQFMAFIDIIWVPFFWQKKGNPNFVGISRNPFLFNHPRHRCHVSRGFGGSFQEQRQTHRTFR